MGLDAGQACTIRDERGDHVGQTAQVVELEACSRGGRGGRPAHPASPRCGPAPGRPRPTGARSGWARSGASARRGLPEFRSAPALHHDHVVGQALASDSRWVHMTTVRPSMVFSSRISSSTAWEDSGSSPEVGSRRTAAAPGGAGSTGRARVASSCRWSSRRRAAPARRRCRSGRPASPMAAAVALQPVELGGVGQVVVTREAVVEGGLGRHHSAAGGAPGGRRGRDPARRCAPSPPGARARR